MYEARVIVSVDFNTVKVLCFDTDSLDFGSIDSEMDRETAGYSPSVVFGILGIALISRGLRYISAARGAQRMRKPQRAADWSDTGWRSGRRNRVGCVGKEVAS